MGITKKFAILISLLASFQASALDWRGCVARLTGHPLVQESEKSLLEDLASTNSLIEAIESKIASLNEDIQKDRVHRYFASRQLENLYIRDSQLRSHRDKVIAKLNAQFGLPPVTPVTGPNS